MANNPIQASGNRRHSGNGGGSSDLRHSMESLDGAKVSSITARIAAGLVVLCLVLVSPIMLDMYMTIKETQKVSEINNQQVKQKLKQLDEKMKELDGQTTRSP